MTVDCSFNLLNAIISLAGIAIGGLIGFFSARRIADRNALAAAGAKLNLAFVPSLVRLNDARQSKASPNGIEPDYFLRDELPIITLAAREFRHSVSKSKVAQYDDAWNDYYQAIKQGGVTMAQAHDESDPWSVIEKKIHAVLQFAKP